MIAATTICYFFKTKMAFEQQNVLVFSDVYYKYRILNKVDVSSKEKIGALLRMNSLKTLFLKNGKYTAYISATLYDQKKELACPTFDVKLFGQEIVGPILITKVIIHYYL